MREGSSLVAAWACLLAAGVAHAGECPAGQRGVNLAHPPFAATANPADETLASFDLSENYPISGRLLRLRRLTVPPGGVIPWHGHEGRPGVLTIVSGEMTEYRSTCRTPIVHRAGEGAEENGPFFHQWRNEGNVPAVILSADLPVAAR
jgi:quercetin dioxygenase-like cupin family protein